MRKTLFPLLFVCYLPAVTYSQQNAVLSSLRQKSKQAISFCQTNNYNTDFCILIDLSKHSGLKRLFVWDFKRDTISASALVSHGCGSNPWSWEWSKEKALLSNQKGSHLSSAGKYRIGKRGYSNWGIHVKYLMHGLEKTNSNALARQIVLHSWKKIPDAEVFPRGTPEGWGCPAVSNIFMTQLDPKLKTSKKSVLLWIYQ